MKPEQRIGLVNRVHCVSCRRPTDHTIRGAYDEEWNSVDDGEGGFLDVEGYSEHDLLSCNGCSSGTYRITSWMEGSTEPSIVLHPERNASNTREPKEFDQIGCSNLMESVYVQTVRAYSSGLRTLAGAGVRLVIEGICTDQGVIDGPIFDKMTGAPVVNKNGVAIRRDNLEGRINGLIEKGIASRSQAEHLHQIRFLGNDAAHELDRADPEVISQAIDIVEHLMEQVYQHPAKVKVLESRKRPNQP